MTSFTTGWGPSSESLSRRVYNYNNHSVYNDISTGPHKPTDRTGGPHPVTEDAEFNVPPGWKTLMFPPYVLGV